MKTITIPLYESNEPVLITIVLSEVIHWAVLPALQTNTSEWKIEIYTKNDNDPFIFKFKNREKALRVHQQLVSNM